MGVPWDIYIDLHGGKRFDFTYTFGQHIFAESFDILPGQDLGSVLGLNGDLEQLLWQCVLQFGDDSLGYRPGLGNVGYLGQFVHSLAIQVNVNLKYVHVIPVSKHGISVSKST